MSKDRTPAKAVGDQRTKLFFISVVESPEQLESPFLLRRQNVHSQDFKYYVFPLLEDHFSHLTKIHIFWLIYVISFHLSLGNEPLIPLKSLLNSIEKPLKYSSSLQ